jgi:hypothetical protein
MLVDMQGFRYDGQSWPGFNGLIDVPDWEATQLVDNHNAEWPEEPELARGYDVLKIADDKYEDRLKLADGSDQDAGDYNEDELTAFSDSDLGDADYDDDFDRDELDEDPEPEPVTEQVKRPADYASKSDWIDYAVARDADRSLITKMTKAWIIEAYGD